MRLTVNLDTSLGLVNGSVGLVTKFSQEGVTVLFENKIEILIEHHEYSFDDGIYLVKRYQIPLTLAWKATIHTSQGATFNFVELHLSQAFGAGMVYVALSRCRTIEGLFLDSIIPGKIKVDPDVLEFEQFDMVQRKEGEEINNEEEEKEESSSEESSE